MCVVVRCESVCLMCVFLSVCFCVQNMSIKLSLIWAGCVRKEKPSCECLAVEVSVCLMGLYAGKCVCLGVCVCAHLCACVYIVYNGHQTLTDSCCLFSRDSHPLFSCHMDHFTHRSPQREPNDLQLNSAPNQVTNQICHFTSRTSVSWGFII